MTLVLVGERKMMMARLAWKTMRRLRVSVF
jgi:hypothetical protein